MMHTHTDVSPLADSRFRRLFTAQVIALIGTGMTTVALTLLAYDLAGANAGVVLGTALAFKMVAYVVFAPVIGGLAHRVPRKQLLVTLDIARAAVVLVMPFVTEVWQVYLLIFLLNLCSAGFTPVFSATIPEILGDERRYTRALSLSRLAYDLESLLSPTLAGIALLFISYSGLFMANSLAFLVSAALIVLTLLPAGQRRDRIGGLRSEITFGVMAYLRTPRLRALLTLYMAVACASAMVIVNTVVYVKVGLGGTDSQVAAAFAAAGCGSMLAALLMPRLLDTVADRPVMLTGAVLMGIGMLGMALGPAATPMLGVWFLIGAGWSMVQTPAGRLVNRSAAAGDRPAYFSAQFALSHACWLLAYPLAGQLGARIGIEQTALLLGAAIFVFSLVAALIWPRPDVHELEHVHESVEHLHPHTHGSHHTHPHRGDEGPEPHVHPHQHGGMRHSHQFVIDEHHPHWPRA